MRLNEWQRIGIVLSIVWAVPASAQVMYKCTAPDGYIGYGFQARGSFDCSAITMSDAYRDGIVPKELSLVCNGATDTLTPDIPSLVEKHTATFHLVNGRWNNGPCLWSAKHIFCGKDDDGRFGVPSGYPSLSIDRFSGSVDYMDVSPGVMRTFKGTCEIKTKPKF
jgi:hypothetical protein